MKILIIGSKGFIGSHCVKHFARKHEVWQCDIILDYNTPRYFIIDPAVSNYNSLFEQNAFDICINCSGAASVPYSLSNPLIDFNLNTANVISILEAIRTHNSSCRFLNLSSAAVYGNPDVLPVSIGTKTSPISPYGFHKMMAEQICEEYYKFWNVRSCSVRIFSAYGPGLKKQLFWDLFNKLNASDRVELWGTGNESRDFIYIEDLVKSLDLIVNNCPFTASVVNVANGKQITTSQIAHKIEELFQNQKTIIFNGKVRPGDPCNWEADITQIKEWGYAPSVDIEQGISNYYQWLRQENILA